MLSRNSLFVGAPITFGIVLASVSLIPSGPPAPQGLTGFDVLRLARTQPPLEGPVRSPSGRIVQPGAVDPLGYRLPLDVIYEPYRPAPRDEHGNLLPQGPREAYENLGTEDERGSREESSRTRDDARGTMRGAPFEEHRLGPDDDHTENETSIDVVGNTVIGGWNQYLDGGGLVMGVGRSTDGGHTWASSTITGHTALSDPAVKSPGGGKWYFAYLASGGPGGGDIDIYVRRSTDDGATWSSPVDASQNGSFDDKPYIASRGDDVLVGWADFGFSPAKLKTSRSTNGGASFSAITILSNNSTAGNGACPVIAPNGDYFMFWRDSFQDSLWVSRSTDRGTSWSPDRGIVGMNPLPSTLPGNFRVVNLPSAAVDPLTGDLVVVWNDQLLGNPDILSVRSTDSGSTWSAPVRVNDDAGTSAQWFPWIAFDENGVAHVVWYDRRNDASDIDVYYAKSTDRGVTFAENVRVTEQSFPVVLPSDTTLRFIGDYNGIAANATTVFPFFQDSRRGEQDVYVALLPNGTTDVDAPELAASDTWSMMAAPNPFELSTRIVLRRKEGSSPASAAVDVIVLDAAGRKVRALVAESAGSEISVSWDGNDAEGRPVAAGVYYARVQADGVSPDAPASGTRIVRVR